MSARVYVLLFCLYCVSIHFTNTHRSPPQALSLSANKDSAAMGEHVPLDLIDACLLDPEIEKKHVFSAFADVSNLTCQLCERRFKSVELLANHELLSDLHKRNLQAQSAAGSGSKLVPAPAPTSLAHEEKSALRTAGSQQVCRWCPSRLPSHECYRVARNLCVHLRQRW